MAADEEDNQRIIGEGDVSGRIQVQQEEDGAQNRPEDGENFDFPAPLKLRPYGALQICLLLLLLRREVLRPMFHHE